MLTATAARSIAVPLDSGLRGASRARRRPTVTASGIQPHLMCIPSNYFVGLGNRACLNFEHEKIITCFTVMAGAGAKTFFSNNSIRISFRRAPPGPSAFPVHSKMEMERIYPDTRISHVMYDHRCVNLCPTPHRALASLCTIFWLPGQALFAAIDRLTFSLHGGKQT